MQTAKKLKISSAQIRAARALLNWSTRELSERSGISQSAISRAERSIGRRSMRKQGLLAIKSTFERFGVEFLDDCGVSLTKRSPDETTEIQAPGPPQIAPLVRGTDL